MGKKVRKRIRNQVIADTSGIIALLDRSEQYHSQVVEVIKKNRILIPVTIIPEIDYYFTERLNNESVTRSLINDIKQGAFQYLNFELEDLIRSCEIMAQYKGFPIGFVDSSIVALAERHNIRKILTLDRRHFGSITTDKIEYLELLPPYF